MQPLQGPLGTATLEYGLPRKSAKGRVSYEWTARIRYQDGRVEVLKGRVRAGSSAAVGRVHQRVLQRLGLRENLRATRRSPKNTGLIDPRGRFRMQTYPSHPKAHELGLSGSEAEKRYVTFHSKPVEDVVILGDQDAVAVDFAKYLPKSLPLVGRGIHVLYRCRKDDPLTRAEREIDPNHDPDGNVGVVKDFIHRHDHSHGGKFSISRGPEVLGIGPKVKGPPGRQVKLKWPPVVYWLGNFTGVAYIDRNDKQKTLPRQAGWELWAFPDQSWGDPDGHTLFAVPNRELVEAHYDGKPIKNLIVWRGGVLNVTYHGIGG